MKIFSIRSLFDIDDANTLDFLNQLPRSNFPNPKHSYLLRRFYTVFKQ